MSEMTTQTQPDEIGSCALNLNLGYLEDTIDRRIFHSSTVATWRQNLFWGYIWNFGKTCFWENGKWKRRSQPKKLKTKAASWTCFWMKRSLESSWIEMDLGETCFWSFMKRYILRKKNVEENIFWYTYRKILLIPQILLLVFEIFYQLLFRI